MRKSEEYLKQLNDGKIYPLGTMSDGKIKPKILQKKIECVIRKLVHSNRSNNLLLDINQYIQES